jgi:NAD(P)-dependent dehydrogenase (short-subunit alcohol dehydrogenase family)/acyl carrier protein
VVTGTLRRDDGGPGRFLLSLASVHVHGTDVDWAAVLGGGHRVDLPTYPFQRQRYWPDVTIPVALGKSTAVTGGDGAPSAAEERFWAAVEDGDVRELADTLAIADQRWLGEVMPALASWRQEERDRAKTANWRYRISWAPLPEPGPAVLSGTWLVVIPADEQRPDPADACVREIAARGAQVVVIEAETGEADRVRLADQIRRALNAAGNGAEFPVLAGVLSLLAVDETPVPGHPMVAAGLAATQALVQALCDAPTGAPLWVLTRGAVAAGESQPLASPVQAQVWGMGRVAGLEHPDWWGGLIDLPPAPDERAWARLCAVLAGTGEDQVAIRATGMLARRLERTRLPHSRKAWVPRGSVLITGGTGAIAGHVSRWLARRNAPRIVLASRSGPAAAGAAVTAAELAAAGTEVAVVACDSARRAPLAGLLSWIGRGGPELTAVMHAAGASQASTLEETTLAELADVLAAKAAGAAHLDELTAELDLDAFVVFSSAAATWGSGRQPGYAAANAFLDALATSRRDRGLAATSIAWGLWSGGGMGSGDGGTLLQRHGVLAMDPRVTVKALGQALDGGETLLTVADVDWARFAPPFTLRRPSPLIEALPEVRQALSDAVIAADGVVGSDTGTALAQQLAGQPRTEQDRILMNTIRAEAAAVLGYSSPEAIEAGRAFRDLGFDSLTAMELRNRLTAATGIRLPATLVFDYPSPAVLAEYLWTEEFSGAAVPIPLVEELDKLESLLSDTTPDDATYEMVTARLRGCLSRWSNIEVSLKNQAVAQQIESASDDEIFDFIHNELGGP